MRFASRLLIALALMIVVTAAGASAQQGAREQTLADGTAILAGVELDTATPIATLLGDPEGFDGELVQIEGTVVAICQMMGCWVALEDAEGNRLNVKVEDGVVDLREVAETAHYMVAEGVFQKTGEHGAQVFIMEHGAVVAAGS